MKRILVKCAMCALLIALASCGAKSEKQNNDVVEVKTEQQNLNIFNDLGVEFGTAKDTVLKKVEGAGASYRLNDDDYEIYGLSYISSEFGIPFFVTMDFDDGKLHKVKMMSDLDLNEPAMKEKFEEIVTRFNKRGYKVTENRSDSLTVESDYWAMQLWSDRVFDDMVFLEMEVVELQKQ